MSTALVPDANVLASLLVSLALPPGSAARAQPDWLKTLRGRALERAHALRLPNTDRKSVV